MVQLKMCGDVREMSGSAKDGSPRRGISSLARDMWLSRVWVAK